MHVIRDHGPRASASSVINGASDMLLAHLHGLVAGIPFPRLHPLPPTLILRVLLATPLLQLLAEGRVSPYLRAPLDERKRNQTHGQTQEPQQRAGPAHAQRLIHGPRGERQHGTKERTRRRRGGCGRSGENLVRVDHVVDERHEEQQEADADRDAADDGHDPVHRRARRPANPEETNGEERPADAGERQAAVLLDTGPRFALRLGLAQERVPPEVDDAGEDGTDANAEEGEALLAEREAVDGWEDDGEGLEKDVHNGVDEGEVEAGEDDDGLEEEHAKGAAQEDSHQLAHSGFLEVQRSPYVRSGRLPADFASAALQDDGCIGLWEECQRNCASSANRQQGTEVYGPKVVEVMKMAIARPRATGSLYRSAYMPPVTLIGEEAKNPARNRKARKADQLGARQDPSAKAMKPAKDSKDTDDDNEYLGYWCPVDWVAWIASGEGDNVLRICAGDLQGVPMGLVVHFLGGCLIPIDAEFAINVIAVDLGARS
ncbi:hypothetical protein FH972_025013 [Carpinus fangiana]|uniref:Uncharacterized protein n=1 Tax=Carpinus fangiana TaxID=176857 RepID=A0A5N6L0C4_9ROSI|nr:hypothetical protein FH972_025013 [Carpinus fangiana]